MKKWFRTGAGRRSQVAACTLLLALFILCPARPSLAGDAGVFTGTDAATVIGAALANSGTGNDIKVRINGIRDEDILSTAGAPISAEADNLAVDREHGSWKATLLFKAADKNLAPVNLSGTYDEMVQIPVLKRQVRSGEVITADDIALSTFSGKNLRKNTITDNKELIGKSPRRMISQGRPVRQDEIGNPAVLLKGAHVTMLFKTRNLEITTLGEALENGAKGDVIRVKNLASKQIIDAVVEAPGRVRVASPETSAAEAM